MMLVIKAQYKVLDGIDAQEQAKFLALTKSLQPMVDKVLELLPLYLALSTQTEGARRLLVMVRLLLHLHPRVNADRPLL